MSKFDHIWASPTLKPEAIELRQSGLTPQQTCTELAWTRFNDGGKYNIVKGWYKRTFPEDWPIEEGNASFKERVRRPNRIPHQLSADHNTNVPPAYPSPQKRQNYYPSEENLMLQLSSATNSGHRPASASHQGSRQTPQLLETAIHASFSQGFHQYPTTSYFPQGSSAAARHRTYQENTAQNQQHRLVQQMSSAPFDPQYRQEEPQFQPYSDFLQSRFGAIESSCQRNFLQSRQYNHQPQPAPTDEGRYPVRRDSLPQSSGIFGQNVSQRSPGTQETPHIDEYPPEIDVFHDHMRPDFYKASALPDEGVGQTVMNQQVEIQIPAVPNRFVLLSNTQTSSPLQHPNHQSALGPAAESFTRSPLSNQTYNSPRRYSNSAVGGQNKPIHTAVKQRRGASLLLNPTPPPQYSLPPDPPMKYSVIHKGFKQDSWKPVRMNGNSMVEVDPNEFPTEPCRKRVRGQPGYEARDSIVIHQKHIQAPHSIPPRNPIAYVMQTVTTQNSTIKRPVNPSNISVHSSLRDSGYISNFESAVVESMRSSLSSFKLTEDPNVETEYNSDDEGFVEVEVKAKWRMRRSDIEKRESLVLGTDA